MATGSVSKEPLDINNLMLRGSVLRKTDWVVGLAINVGADSKIVQNMTKAPRKVLTPEGSKLIGQSLVLIAVHSARNGCWEYWQPTWAPVERPLHSDDWEELYATSQAHQGICPVV